MSKICKKCHVAILKPHHELLYWFKCVLCGYTEFNLEFLSAEDQERARNDKFAKIGSLNEKMWKPWLNRPSGQD